VNVADTAVTDRAVEALKLLKHLNYISLRATKITPAGKAELRERFPKASILDM